VARHDGIEGKPSWQDSQRASDIAASLQRQRDKAALEAKAKQIDQAKAKAAREERATQAATQANQAAKNVKQGRGRRK